MLKTDFTDKDYEAFRNMMIEELQNILPQYTDTTQTDAGIVIIELLAKGLDILSYYQDNIANETFLSTCEQLSSVLRWCNILGYSPKNNVPSVCKQVFVKSLVNSPVTIYRGTQVQTDDGIIFETIDDLYLPKGVKGDEQDENGDYQYSVDVVQGYTVGNYNEGVLTPTEFVGTSDGSENQTYTLSSSPALIEGIVIDKQVFGELIVMVNNVVWERVDSFIYSSAESQHYTATLNEYGQIVLTFGSHLLGQIPNKGSSIYASYRVGGGSSGNVSKNTITAMVENLSGISKTFNISEPSGDRLGSDKEDIEQIKLNAPRMYRTIERAITLQDFSDIILLNEDFEPLIHSIITYRCEDENNPYYKDTVQIYVQFEEDFKKAVKNSEENFIFQILASMREYVEERQPIGTFAVLSEAQSQSIGIKATLVVTEGYNESQIKDKAKSAAYEFLSKGAFTLNRAFDAIIFERYICLIDGVEYFRVNSITTKGSETSALLVKPDKGKYFELNITENDKGENPNFVVSIANYGE